MTDAPAWKGTVVRDGTSSVVHLGAGTQYSTGAPQPTTVAQLSVTGSIYAKANATEHHFETTWDGQNAVSHQNLSSTGYSATRFLDSSGVEHAAVGYGNTACGVPAFSGRGYLEAYCGDGVSAITPLALVTTGTRTDTSVYSQWTRALFAADMTNTFQGVMKVQHDQAVNPLKVQCSSAAGYSTAEFQDSAGTPAAFLGHGNSGGGLPNIVYLATQSATTTPKALQIMQFLSNGGSSVIRQKFATDGTITLYGNDGTTAAVAISADGLTVTTKAIAVVNTQAAAIASAVVGAAAQTANLAEWRKSDATVYSTVSENGFFTTRKIAAPADAELSNSELSWWLDATPGATKAMFKAKDSAGTVRSGSVALA